MITTEFGAELMVRIANVKYGKLPLLSQRLIKLMSVHIFPRTRSRLPNMCVDTILSKALRVTHAMACTVTLAGCAIKSCLRQQKPSSSVIIRHVCARSSV